MADTVTWENSIKELFTQLDIGCMRARPTNVDLSDYQSVVRNKQAIYDRVEDGRMPKGGPRWSPEMVALFKAWMDAGCPEN